MSKSITKDVLPLLDPSQRRSSEIIADKFIQEHVAYYKKRKQEEANAKVTKVSKVGKNKK